MKFSCNLQYFYLPSILKFFNASDVSPNYIINKMQIDNNTSDSPNIKKPKLDDANNSVRK